MICFSPFALDSDMQAAATFTIKSLIEFLCLHSASRALASSWRLYHTRVQEINFVPDARWAGEGRPISGLQLLRHARRQRGMRGLTKSLLGMGLRISRLQTSQTDTSRLKTYQTGISRLQISWTDTDHLKTSQTRTSRL